MSKYLVPSNLAVSDSGFLFMPSTGETFTLNQCGREIFKMIQSGKEFEDALEFISGEYDIDPVSAEKDLHDFLAQLKNYNLIKEL
ncbi:MAG: PqqD family protein [Ignavibacteriales bacterium]|jgi:hypothetical protein|nr:MAG: PqqD family protein [Ignavibacteriales bacterium]